MNQRKQNISRWCILGLAAVLTAGCLMLSVGTAYARYGMDSERLIHFVSRTPAQPALGIGVDADFESTGAIGWQEVLLTELVDGTEQTRKVYRLEFTIANYLDLEGFDSEDMRVALRLVGSQDAWTSGAPGSVVLTDGTLLEDGTPRQYVAAIEPIAEGTRLHHDFGMGWVFRFLDDYGRELTWDLEGGKLSCVPIQITVDASAVNGTSLLQLRLEAERVE